jgi:putative ABC transport system permease protein
MRSKHWLYTIPLRMRSLLRRKEVEQELSDELQFHLEQKTREYVASGLTREEARRRAMREFGGVELSKENCRDTRRVRVMETLWHDVRFALRILRKSPGFTATVILTLGLGIGANAAIFSAVYAVLLKPLPYSQPDQLVMVYEDVRLPNYQNDRNEPSPGNFSSWKNQNTVFESMAAYRNRSWNLTGSGEPVRVEGEMVSAEFFTALRANAEMGRVFTKDDDRPGNAHVVVITDGFWKTQFGSDREILGKKILLDGESYEVIGVLPPRFHYPDPDDQLWVPMALPASELANFGSHYLNIFARLKPGASVLQANRDLNLIARQITELHPDSNTGQTVNVLPLREVLVGSVRPALLVLLGAVGLTLLIVCANVANLLLARASVRHREMAVRLALGAGRSRILAQLLTESFVLALFGCAVGLLLARVGINILKLLAAAQLPRVDELNMNGAVYAFAVIIAISSALVFGVVAAWQARREDVYDTLKAGARESAGGPHLRMRGLLVVMETALGVVVVIGAGLLLRSFLLIEQVPLGFESQNVLTFRVIPRGERYSQLSQRATFYRQAAERIEALPGVESAAGVSFIPLTLARGSKGFTMEGRAPSSAGQIPMANYDVVTPGYFSTMQIPLREGREFSWSDTSEGQPVVIINKALAERYWPGTDPLGQRIRQGGPSDTEFPWLTIAGIVGDVREFDPLTPPRATMYFPATQFQDAGGVLRDWVIKTKGNPGAVAASIPAAIWDVDKDLPVTRIKSMETVRSQAVAAQRLNLLLFASFAILALLLATIGIYGVTSYGVAQRTREIGIRVALGARASEVVRLAVAQGLGAAACGLLLGLMAAFSVARFMRSMIYGVGSTDPVTYLCVALLLALVAVAACYLPARRAARVDPVIALRYE